MPTEANPLKFIGRGENTRFANCHSFGVDETNVRANLNVSTRGVEARLELVGWRVGGEVGYFQGEVGPNYTTAASIGVNGIEGRLAGVGCSITPYRFCVHTPFGSVGIRNPWK